jgi:uncharacterized protein YndB with AHSA1/START domain
MIPNHERSIKAEILVHGSMSEVWECWTTEHGARTFFAPECRIDLQPGGAYEMYFALEFPRGLRGGEGCTVMAIQPLTMFAFTWNAPPTLPEVRGQYTHVVVRLAKQSTGTQVRLCHDGWGSGGEWDQAFAYFDAAWKRVVLPRLVYRFEHGPVDWNDPPKFTMSTDG